MGNVITVSDLAAEFTRIAAMPDDTFFADGAKLYMNSYVTDDPTDEEKEKYEALEQLTRDLVGMMDDLLITDKGGCNWTNINALKKLGYDVYPTDQDSFGWLCAAVEKNNHIVIYG